MSSTYRLILVAAASWAIALDAAEIRIVSVQPLQNCPATAIFRAQRIDGVATPIEQPVSLSDVTKVTLPRGLWEMHLFGSGFWASPFYGQDADTITVKVWRTASINGTSTGITALRAHFTPVGEGPSGEVDCTVDRTSWTCVVPEGRYDLTFRSHGFAPEFRFAVAVPTPDAKLALRFVPGASLSGMVETSRGEKTSVEGVEISLESPVGDRLQKQSVRTNPKGFFQFKGISPGDYSLRASKGTEFFSQRESVKILAGAAAELNAPLLLDRPKQLVVSVMPLFDPDGRPWRVRLLANNIRLRHQDLIAESSTSVAGEWTHSRLVSGEYMLQLLTSKGEQWRSEAVAIAQNDVTKVIAALPTRITGVVTLGDRPLQAALTFGAEWGVKLFSDADGRFEGKVPPQDLSERLVLIEADKPPVRRTVRVKVEKAENGEMQARIKLRATALKGVIVDSDHAPQANAIVTVSGDNPDTFEQTWARSDGTFEIGGFEPGRYRAIAEVFERRSQSVAIELNEDSATEIELTVEQTVRVVGHITVGETPVIASEIYALPRDRWAPTVPVSRSNEAGFFELELPPGTTTFDGVAVHPAFDIVIGRANIQPEKQMHIRTAQIGGKVIIEATAIDDVMLLHNGAEIQASWLATQAGGTLTTHGAAIPRLQPGHYSACSRTKHKCAEGDLAPFGTLTLNIAD